MAFVSLSELGEREIIPGYRATFVHTQGMTIAHWSIDAGAELPAHSHPHEQVVNLIAGEYELTVGDETRVLRPGMVAIIPPDTPHGGKALSDCWIIDAFHPARDDYR
jgi:quercetin dioxygenase-like cupin family protein